MATIKISQLPEKATMVGTEEVLINDSGTSKKFSTQRFLDVKTSTETARDAALAAQTAAETAETNAETAETNASGSATTAGTHATNASTSETNAATSETNAATSATSASGSATAAAASAASAAATYDTFDDRYLGNKASDPTTDNDGDALVQGMLYFDSTNNLMKVYDGSSWITTSSATLATLDVYKFTATSGQTAFTGTDDDGNTLAIKPTAEMVTLNGIVLEPGADYTVTSGTLTLLAGATVSDEVNVYAFGNFELADHYNKATSDSRYLAKAGGTMTGDVSLGDNVKAKFGASDDLQIYHDGSDSIIADVGTGELVIRGSNAIKLGSHTGELYFNGVLDGAVNLYHNNSAKLATTSTGVDVTGSVTCDGFTSTGIDDNATTTAITVTSVGDVQIGKTINDFGATAGTEIRKGNGRVFVGSTDGAFINRIGSDGNIIGLRKDGTTVGSIGTRGGNLSIGSGDVSLEFNASNDALLPSSTTTNNTRDAAVDLGISSVRFKDLYLSGGVYLGGTAAANALDDYEEGTFTLGNVGGTQSNFYTKIGRMVFLDISIAGTMTSNMLTGLPFATLQGTSFSAWNNGYAPGAGYTMNYVASGTNLYFRRLNQSTGAYAALADLVGNDFKISMSYAV